MNTFDAIVIGGGLHGLSAAMQLGRRGLSVALLERRRVGRHSSGASAAGVRTMGRARAELPISLAAMDMWHNISALVGDDCGFQPNGQVKVIETEDEFIQEANIVEGLRLDGYSHEEIIDAVELKALVPAIAPHCLGGRFARNDGAADPHRTLAAFLKAATLANVTIKEGSGVVSLRRCGEVWNVRTDTETLEAPLVVNAAGAWAGQIAALAGDVIPLAKTKASMMIVTERVAPFVRPTVTAAGRSLSFKQTTQGTVLIGGGVQGRPDLAAEQSQVDALALAKAAASAMHFFPVIGRLRIIRSWAGLEANSPDGAAIAGLSDQPGLMHLFGFTGHGFQLVPALGLATAELLLDGHSTVDLSGLRPQRLMSSIDPGDASGRAHKPKESHDRSTA